LQQGTVIAAVRTEEDFCAALKTNINLIFDLNPDLLTLAERVKKAHQAGKKLLIHFDLATGIGKDKSGITFVKTTGAEGVISTRASVIKMAKELHLFTVQRFFILDSQSLHTTVETLKTSKADMIEIMPGIIPKMVAKLKQETQTPIIAGGLIETEEEVRAVIESGAAAISTGKMTLWGI